MKPMTPFFFGALHDEGLRVTLMGEFHHRQLFCASLDGVTWKRSPAKRGKKWRSASAPTCANSWESLGNPHSTLKIRLLPSEEFRLTRVSGFCSRKGKGLFVECAIRRVILKSPLLPKREACFCTDLGPRASLYGPLFCSVVTKT